MVLAVWDTGRHEVLLLKSYTKRAQTHHLLFPFYVIPWGMGK